MTRCTSKVRRTERVKMAQLRPVIRDCRFIFYPRGTRQNVPPRRTFMKQIWYIRRKRCWVAAVRLCPIVDMPCVTGGTTVLRRHGDAFERLPGGFYVAHGRIDDTMNLGGIKVRLHPEVLSFLPNGEKVVQTLIPRHSARVRRLVCKALRIWYMALEGA